MGKVTPISQPIDKEIKKIEEKQDRARYFIERIKKERQDHLDIISNYKGLSPDEIEMAKSEIAKFDDAIAQAEEAIKIGDDMISEQMERKARLSGQKPTELKIR